MKKRKIQLKNISSVALWISLAVNILFLAYIFQPRINKLIEATRKVAQKNDKENLFDQINPEKGYEIDASYGGIGPKMIASGVIDLEKFKSTYEQGGNPLNQEQLDILTKGSNNKVKITRDNSYFLLNFFWAAGLANKSKVLTEGDIIIKGDGVKDGTKIHLRK